MKRWSWRQWVGGMSAIALVGFVSEEAITPLGNSEDTVGEFGKRLGKVG